MAMEMGFNADAELEDEIPVSAAFLLQSDPLCVCDSDPLSLQNGFGSAPCATDPLNGTRRSKSNFMVWEDKRLNSLSADLRLKSGAVVVLEDIMKNCDIVRTYGLDKRTPLRGTQNVKEENDRRTWNLCKNQVVIKIEPGAKEAEIDEMFSFAITHDTFNDVPSTKNRKRSGSTKRQLGSKRGRVGRPPGSAKKKRGPKPRATRTKTSERRKTAIKKEAGYKGRGRPSKKSEKNKWEPRLKAIRDLRKKRRRDIKKLESRAKRIERRQIKLKRWSIRNMLKSRRRYRIKSELLSEKVAIALERIVSGTGKVKSFRRQMLSNKRAVKGRPSNTPSKKLEDKDRRKWLKCFYCSKQLLGKSNRKRHHETMHPEMVRLVKLGYRIKFNEWRRTQFKKAKETGEGPQWVLNTINKGKNCAPSKGREDNRKTRKKHERKRTKIKKAMDTGEGPQWVLNRTQPGNNCDKNRRVICEECGELVTVKNLPKHKQKHDSNRPMNKCPLCPESFVAGFFLWHHFTQVHLNHDLSQMSREKGMMRGFKYYRNIGNEDKEVTDLPEPERICEICAQTFPSEANLKRHVMNVHTEEGKKFSCRICGRTFKTKDSKDAHIRQIHEGLDYRCDICHRKTQSKGKLWRHKVEHDGMSDLLPPEGLTILECQYCDEKLLKAMGAHVKQRHPEKFHEYVLQKKSSKSNNQKPVSANQRERDMMRKREMRRKWLEEGILTQPWVAKRRPINCPRCGLAVTKSVDWPAHLRDAHGIIINGVYDTKDLSVLEPKWICPASGCEESFTISANLKRHVSAAHNELEKGLQREGHVKVFHWEGDLKYRFFRCNLCSGVKSIKEFGRDRLNSMDEMRIHFFLNHQEIYKRLKGELDSDPDLEGNEVLTTESLTVICGQCSEECLGDDELREHMLELHPQECWRCPEEGCSRIILNPEELERHFMTSHLTQSATEGEISGPAVGNSGDGSEFKALTEVKFEVEIKYEPGQGISHTAENEASSKSTGRRKGRRPGKKSTTPRAKADKSNKGRKVKPKVEVNDGDGNAPISLRRSSRPGRNKRYDDFESDIDD